jgi:hypothetical protein
MSHSTTKCAAMYPCSPKLRVAVVKYGMILIVLQDMILLSIHGLN